MFKGTNKLAKVLAVALVLCMLPMAAFAEAPTAKTVAITTTADAAAAAYEAGEAIEIAGTTTSGTVTMLAVRDADAIAEGALNPEFDFTKVVYAGQKAASEGAFSFKFFPKADVAGAMLTVFVGGEGVSDLATLSFSVAEPAPAVAAEWYKGEALTITLSRVTGAAQADWFTAVDVIKLGEVEIAKDTITIEDNKIVFTAAQLADLEIATLSSIKFIDNDGIYNTAKAEGLSLPALKPAGTITVTYPDGKDYFIAGAEVSVAIDDSNIFSWLAAFRNGLGTVLVNGVETEYDYSETLEAQFVEIDFAFADDFTEGTYVVTLKADDFEDATAEIAFKASAPLDAPSVVAPVEAFTGAWMDGAPESADKDALYGKYAVELPATGENGSTITWSVKVDEAEYVAASGTYELVRPATDGADSASYTFKALVSGVGKDVEVGPFPAIEVNKYGMPVHGHGAPSITDVAITPAPEADNVVANVALTAATVGWYDNKGYADASTFTWTVEGKTPVAGANFTPEVADIGKTLTVTATPTVVEEEPFTGTPVSKTFTIILDPEYKPEISVGFKSATLRVGGTAEAVVTDDVTYAAVEKGFDASNKTICYYEVAAELVAEAEDKAAKAVEIVAGLEGELEGVTLLEEAKYETAGNFAVIKVVATYKIAEKDLEPVEAYAALEVSKKASTNGGGGASLKPTKPVDPKPEDPKPEDPKPEDPISGEGNANGAAAFTDVDKAKYDWAYEGIDALTKAGVFKGMTPTTFGPELTTTNAQVIALAVRIAGLKAEDGAKTDLVADDHWVYAEMTAADKAGILGVFGGKVAVEEATTREVAFTLLYNALKAAGIELAETAEAIEYTDASSIDAACVEAITALTKAGIVNGMGDGTLAPKATITRAQLAKILGIAQSLIK